MTSQMHHGQQIPADRDAPAHRMSSEPRRPRDRALIVAAFGFAGLLLANVVTGAYGDAQLNATLRANAEQQQAQLRADREQEERNRLERLASEDRDRRTKVYKAFLDTSNDYANATYQVVRECASTDPAVTRRCLQQRITGADFTARRNAFQGAINDISVYGSQDAWSTAQDLAGTLPPSVGNSPFTDPDTVIDRMIIDQRNYTSWYRLFLLHMRGELQATPFYGEDSWDTVSR